MPRKVWCGMIFYNTEDCIVGDTYIGIDVKTWLINYVFTFTGRDNLTIGAVIEARGDPVLCNTNTWGGTLLWLDGYSATYVNSQDGFSPFAKVIWVEVGDPLLNPTAWHGFQ